MLPVEIIKNIMTNNINSFKILFLNSLTQKKLQCKLEFFLFRIIAYRAIIILLVLCSPFFVLIL